jgi:hypothetical protein
MTTKKIFFEELLNMKVVDNYVIFPESTITQESKFV